MLYILIVKVFGPWPERWYLLLPLGWGEYHCIVPSAHVLFICHIQECQLLLLPCHLD